MRRRCRLRSWVRVAVSLAAVWGGGKRPGTTSRRYADCRPSGGGTAWNVLRKSKMYCGGLSAVLGKATSSAYGQCRPWKWGAGR